MYKYIPVNETRLYTKIIGSGFPIIILHGGPGGDHHLFGNYLDDLSKDFTLIFVDQRGQGKSDDVDMDTLETIHMANDLEELTKQLGYDSYACLGHSFGAFVALEHAVRGKSKISHYIILNGTYSMNALGKHRNRCIEEEIDETLKERVHRSIEMRKKCYAATNQGKAYEYFYKGLDLILPFYFPTAGEANIEKYKENTKGTIFRISVMKYRAEHDLPPYNVTSKLDNIDAKVLFITSEYDYICNPEESKEMHKQIQSSKLVSLPNTGHNSFAEKPHEVKELVRDFLNNP